VLLTPLASVLFLVLGAGTSGATAPQGDGSADAAHRLQITARDDYYDLGTTRVASGLVTAMLHNEGEQSHQAQIGRFKDGATIEQFDAAIKAHQIPRALGLIAGFHGGPNAVRPDRSQTTFQNLSPGQYLVLCFVPEATEPHMPHFAMGMYAGFEVIGQDRSGTGGHESGAVYAVDDMRFDIPAPLETGTVVRFENHATKDVHEFTIARLHPGKSVEDVVTWAKTEQGAAPYDDMGGAGAVDPNGQEWFTLNLRPGDYIALCLVPDDEPPNLPHAANGMVSAFTVVDG
jgi:uncharacterized cupredoxin-like copper-binding protein